MDEVQIRLECLKIVYPKDNAAADAAFFVSKAQTLFEFVTGSQPKRRGRPPKADKSQDPAN